MDNVNIMLLHKLEGKFSNYDFCNKEGILNLWKKFLNNDEAITWSRIWHLVVLNNWIKENKIDC